MVESPGDPALAGSRTWVFTLRSPMASELWETELILGNLSPCRMPVLRVQMMPSGHLDLGVNREVAHGSSLLSKMRWLTEYVCVKIRTSFFHLSQC